MSSPTNQFRFEMVGMNPEEDSNDAAALLTTVAVAVNGSVESEGGGSGSRRAVQWAYENLLQKADRFVLIHVMRAVTTIPTPTGGKICAEHLDDSVVAMYMRDIRKEYEQVFVPFKKMLKDTKVETLLLEHDDPAKALLNFVSESAVKFLVMGSRTSNFLKKTKGDELPLNVLRYAPQTCEIYVVCKDKIITKSVDYFLAGDASNIQSSIKASSKEAPVFGNILGSPPEETVGKMMPGKSSSKKDSKDAYHPARTVSTDISIRHQPSSTLVASGDDLVLSQHGSTMSPSPTDLCSSATAMVVNKDITAHKQFKPVIHEKPAAGTEVESLRGEVRNTVAMYKKACQELVRKQNQLSLLSSEHGNDARRLREAIEKEEKLKKAVAEERQRYSRAVKELEMTKSLLAKEFCERQIAELNALKQSVEKKKIIDQLFLWDRRYRRYTVDEIIAATENFSPSKVVGEGGYGKVYRCSINHTPVAIKVLRTNSVERKEEFLKEIAVLSQLRHPHVVLLLGACPESGCLVYEYLENGSLEDYIGNRKGKPPLPWFIRFRIMFEVACGLAFLHNSKPEPVIHRDLKPGNILLDRNHTSKIGDVGLAKLVPEMIPENITVYRDSIIAGTIHYMDPEYQRTGTIRPKSDLYALGIIILQLLTARHPNGLLYSVEDAIRRHSFQDVLDGSVSGWPIAEAEELARIAIKCSQLRCRDRPDLDAEVLPVLRRVLDKANTKIKMEQDNLHPPSHFFCPILKEIMEEPYIAADGFTYEHRAIRSWLEKHNVSPATKRRLKHTDLTPNHTLRYAIVEWRTRTAFSSALICKDD